MLDAVRRWTVRRASRLTPRRDLGVKARRNAILLDVGRAKGIEIRDAALTLPDQREMRISESLAEPRDVVVGRLEILARLLNAGTAGKEGGGGKEGR